MTTVDQTESFWFCVERVCRRVERRAAVGNYPIGMTTAAMAKQVLEQMASVRETGVAAPPQSGVDFNPEPI